MSTPNRDKRSDAKLVVVLPSDNNTVIRLDRLIKDSLAAEK
jgi:hypothetical protein